MPPNGFVKKKVLPKSICRKIDAPVYDTPKYFNIMFSPIKVLENYSMKIFCQPMDAPKSVYVEKCVPPSIGFDQNLILSYKYLAPRQ